MRPVMMICKNGKSARFEQLMFNVVKAAFHAVL